MSAKTIAFAPRRKGGDAPLVINADTIRYIQMKRNYAEVHLTNGAVFTSRITMEELEQRLQEPIVQRLCVLMRFRNHCACFDGSFACLPSDDRHLLLQWSKEDETCLLQLDLSGCEMTIRHTKAGATVEI